MSMSKIYKVAEVKLVDTFESFSTVGIDHHDGRDGAHLRCMGIVKTTGQEKSDFPCAKVWQGTWALVFERAGNGVKEYEDNYIAARIRSFRRMEYPIKKAFVLK